MDQKLRLTAGGNYFAEVEDYGDHLIIADGWNCGRVTARIQFPTLHTVRTYLAGLWHCETNEILDEVIVESFERELTNDEKLGKLARQFVRGLITENELTTQIFLIVNEEIERIG